MAEKHDVFVGNVTFNTTEEQLQEIFSFVGPIKNIRILTDPNTGRPKGFAFIEYNDANTALAAIRHLDGATLNNRNLRVSYSNNSNLKEVARSIGQLIPDVYQSHVTTKQEFQAVNALQLHEAWDILESMKKLVDDDRGKARSLLEAYPQLIGALIEVQKRLGMVPVVSTAPMESFSNANMAIAAAKNNANSAASSSAGSSSTIPNARENLGSTEQSQGGVGGGGGGQSHRQPYQGDRGGDNRMGGGQRYQQQQQQQLHDFNQGNQGHGGNRGQRGQRDQYRQQQNQY